MRSRFPLPRTWDSSTFQSHRPRQDHGRRALRCGAASGNGLYRGSTPRYHPEPGRERIYFRCDHLDTARTLGRFWSISLGHGSHERHVRGRGRQALLEGLRAFDLHVARGGHSPDRRTRARRLRRVYRCDRRRPRRARIRLRSDLEYRAVARRGSRRSVRLRPDLLLRTSRQTEVPLISPGSVLAFAFWLIFSLLFSLYASTFGGSSYNETYGSLAGVIILMLYVYYSALIMLVGAEMNQV